MVNTVTSAETRALPESLNRLTAESIEIMQEAVAKFKKPVMLCSVGASPSTLRREMGAHSKILGCNPRKNQAINAVRSEDRLRSSGQ